MVDRCHWTAIALFAATVILVLAITAVVVVARPHHEGRESPSDGLGSHHHRHGHGSGGLRNSGEDRPRGQRKDPFQEHVTRVRSFLCRDARPRSITVSELVSEIDDEDSWKPAVGEVVFPPVTVLHRCENTSGCCFEGGTFSCSPLDTERVRLVFMVSVVVSGSNRGNDASDQGQLTDTREETIYAVNHTRCACMAEEPPK